MDWFSSGQVKEKNVQETRKRRTVMRSRKLAVVTVHEKLLRIIAQCLVRTVASKCHDVLWYSLDNKMTTKMSENSNATDEKALPSSTAPSSSASTTEASASATPRRHRYMRSSTAASVTQLLSDSCNSLLQRFRRNPSERPEKRSTNRSVCRNFQFLFFYSFSMKNS